MTEPTICIALLTPAEQAAADGFSLFVDVLPDNRARIEVRHACRLADVAEDHPGKEGETARLIVQAIEREVPIATLREIDGPRAAASSAKLHRHLAEVREMLTATDNPYQVVREGTERLIAARQAGTETDSEALAMLCALLRISPFASPPMKAHWRKISRTLEWEWLSEEARDAWDYERACTVDRAIARAIDAGLPVFEPGGLIALAEADGAIDRAGRGDEGDRT